MVENRKDSFAYGSNLSLMVYFVKGRTFRILNSTLLGCQPLQTFSAATWMGEGDWDSGS